ncbi:hypothetical protein [Bacillus sp. LL01]|uniref:hypothetical protein n=1 Tax=Bacillus sp. LL01 TaxID=1665556 RepID=UPI0018E3B2B3|nr:hypothetical protein [Bacillus sp. LL01]
MFVAYFVDVGKEHENYDYYVEFKNTPKQWNMRNQPSSVTLRRVHKWQFKRLDNQVR